MFGFNHIELLIFAAIALLLFGSRLPQTMRSVGKSITEFKKGIREGENDDKPAEPPKEIGG
ncbi:MAG: twin-arginine translocase TatA/TatE family subunit [Planctomycetaceae bacterium]